MRRPRETQARSWVPRPPAAERAARVGAHREAAAQYARALRFAETLSLEERARLHALRVEECYLSDQQDEAIASARAAIACYRELGDRLAEGRATLRLSTISWCPGLTAESARAGAEAVAILKGLPPGRDLANAYANLATLRADADDLEGTLAFGKRALALARDCGDEQCACAVRIRMAAAEFGHEVEQGKKNLERAMEEAQRLSTGGAPRLAADPGGPDVRASPSVCERRSSRGQGARATRRARGADPPALSPGTSRPHRTRAGAVDGSDEDGCARPRRALDLDAARTIALTVIGLVRARRGDPGVWPLLDEAWRLANGTDEPERIVPVGAARAEAAWLEGRSGDALAATEEALKLALEATPVPRFVGELVAWRRRTGAVEAAPAWGGRAVRGRSSSATGGWPRRVGASSAVPYEAALALAEADEPAALRSALEQLQALGAPAGRRDPGSQAAGARCDCSAWAVPGGAREPGTPDGPRTGGAEARGGGAEQRVDRRAAGRIAPHGGPPRLGDPAQAPRQRSTPGGRGGGCVWARDERWVGPPRNLGRRADAAGRSPPQTRCQCRGTSSSEISRRGFRSRVRRAGSGSSRATPTTVVTWLHSYVSQDELDSRSASYDAPSPEATPGRQPRR